MISLLTTGTAMLSTSCGPPKAKSHPLYRKAEKEMKNQQYTDAAVNFEKFLVINCQSPITHYRLAELYSDYLGKPFLAVYHLKQYLKYNPDAVDKKDVEAWIKRAEKNCAESITGMNIDESKKISRENEQYRNALIKTKNQNAQLMKEIIRLKKAGGGTNAAHSADISVSNGNYSSYTVKSGDNLSRISKKVYGTSKYYKLIFDANSDVLSSLSDLKVGQKLKIPELKKSKQ